MSTLPAQRQVSRDVPVVTADGGTAVAYKDPNSPESIMRRTKEAEVQAAVDSKYDTNVNAYEGFLSTLPTHATSTLLFLLLLSLGLALKAKRKLHRIVFVCIVGFVGLLTFAYDRRI